MTRRTTFEIDGRRWAAESGAPGDPYSGYVLVPVAAFYDLDDHDIMKMAGRLVYESEINTALQTADYILKAIDDRPTPGAATEVERLAESIHPYEGVGLSEIDAALHKARRFAEYARNRLSTPAKRRWVADNYSDLFREIAERDGGARCVYCGTTKALTIDHIIPLIRGGNNSLANLQILCRSCNSSKNSR